MRWLVHALARLAITATCTNSAAALEASVEPTNLPFSSSLSEQMMSNSPETAKTAVVRHDLPRQSSGFVSYDRRAVAVEEQPVTSRPEASATTPPQATGFALFWSVLEGFALYGASLHGIVTAPEVARATEAEPPPAASWRERRTSIALVPAPIAHEISIAVEGDQAARPGRLTAAWRLIANRWAKWQREREISQAVAALSQFDDRTLRDMGIPHRTLIEQTVRYGRDC
jgi:uncharacterized protein YjiS (DUF1127 family)